MTLRWTPLQIAAGGILAIGEESEVAPVRELGRAAAALYIGGMGAKGKNFYNALARRYGYEKEAEEIQDLYLSGKKAEAAALVPSELLEATSLCGPESYLKGRVAALAEVGVTHLNVTPVGGDPVAMIEKLRSWVWRRAGTQAHEAGAGKDAATPVVLAGGSVAGLATALALGREGPSRHRGRGRPARRVRRRRSRVRSGTPRRRPRRTRPTDFWPG